MSNHTHTSRNKNADKKTLYRMASTKFALILFSFISASLIAGADAAQIQQRPARPISSTTEQQGRTQ